MTPPILEFNYDISCPFAYIASTRVQALASRANAKLVYKPVLLGAIYRTTAAPQGAAGSASDVYNPTKKVVAGLSMQRTLRRYKIQYNPPPEHPRKSVDALRLLYCVPDGEERRVLSEAFFQAYWVQRRDVTDRAVLLQIAKEVGISSASSLSLQSFENSKARKDLETSTAQAIARGAFGVPGFWIPAARWTDATGAKQEGRFFWGQDRMHFVEATLLSLHSQGWHAVPSVRSLLPRAIPTNTLPAPTRLEFWFDFSSPWAFLGYTQLARLQRTFPGLKIVLKPFLLGILFREIGAPNMPMAAVSKAKANWSKQDHRDWTSWWNAVDAQDGAGEQVKFQWADVFPIRTPTVLRVGIVEPKTVPALYAACWSHNANVSDEAVLSSTLDAAGFNGTDLIARANAPAIKAKLREFTAEAKEKGICGVPTYRVLRRGDDGEWKLNGGLVWGQDEMGVLEDLIAGLDPEVEQGNDLAESRKVLCGVEKDAKL